MMFQKTSSRIVISALFAIGLFFGNLPTVHAQKAIDNFRAGVKATVEKTGVNASNDSTDLPRLAGTLIGKALSLIAIVFFLITLIAGFYWMFSLGNETRETTARGMIIAAVGGFIVVIGSYAITSFVFTSVVNKKSGPTVSDLTSTDACGSGEYATASCIDASRCVGQEIFSNATGCTNGQVCCGVDTGLKS